jgi:hypothetical protein
VTTEEELLDRGLPKWPQMVVTGKRISEEFALEVIRRTDNWFVRASGCNDREGDRRLAKRFRMPHFYDSANPTPQREDWKLSARWKEAWKTIETQYVTNAWIGSSFIYGPHGWCHPDGTIYYIDNVGKWPSIADVRADWELLATSFPFLDLRVTLMSGEQCEEDTRPVVTMCVLDGQVRLVEPIADLDHRTPQRDMYGAGLAIGMIQPALRERYPFREEVMASWERMAISVDEEIRGKVSP